MTKSKELAVQTPSDEELVHQLRQSIARSPKDIRRGELALIDHRGGAVGRRRLDRTITAWRVGTYAALIGSGVLVGCGAWLPGGLLYLAAMLPDLRVKYRGTGKLMAISLLVRQGHLEEGQRRFDAVPELRSRNPVEYCRCAGNLASHRGDYAAALTWWREAVPRSKGLRRAELKLSITRALLLSGHAAEARREFDTVTFSAHADEVLTEQLLTRVMFVLYDPSTEPPTEDELHDWARRALEYSHTGTELAAIGWAFERSGDEDMARFPRTGGARPDALPLPRDVVAGASAVA